MQEFEDSLQIVIFTIDGVDYAFPINHVKEIIRHVAPQPTSARASWMLGVINLRGTIVPVIDLGTRLGRVTSDHDLLHAKILVLEHNDVTIGAVVSSVEEVRTVSADQVQPAPMGASSHFMDAVVTIDDRLIVLLDATELLQVEAVAA